MKYKVGDVTLEYHVEGDVITGSDQTLLDQAIDLTAFTEWHSCGFGVEPLFSNDEFQLFRKETDDLLRECWRDAGLSFPIDAPLHQYHQYAASQSAHLAAVEKTKLLLTERFPGGIRQIEERISAICGFKLEAFNPYDGARIFHFRVVRPQSRDNNPLHRDVWLPDYADCINLYIPVAGSNEKSSLILLSGSHLWPESKVERTVQGAIINGAKFNVPAVTKVHGDYQVVRPNPQPNEVLVFSPYLVHGGAVNLNDDKTRISIELRLWKSK